MPELPRADEPRPDRCETCRFRVSKFVIDADGKTLMDGDRFTERQIEEDELGGETSAGFCYRYPPTDSGRPEVGLDEWCGEWQANSVIRNSVPVEGKTTLERWRAYRKILSQACNRRVGRYRWPNQPNEKRVRDGVAFQLGMEFEVEWGQEPPSDAGPIIDAIRRADVMAAARAYRNRLRVETNKEHLAGAKYVDAFLAANGAAV